MKYRIRLDLSFNDETAAQAEMDHARQAAASAVSVNEGSDSAVISFAELEICRHDEGLPCTRLDRFEIRGGEVR